MDAFAALAASLDYPMAIVTAADDTEIAGCLVGFWTQSSIEPRRATIFLSKQNHVFGVARRASALVVHALHDRDVEVARHFGETTGDDIDKFAGIAWTPGPGGAPVLQGLDWFAGAVMGHIDAGDHVGFLVEVSPDSGSASRADEPQLGFAVAKSFRPGHEA